MSPSKTHLTGTIARRLRALRTSRGLSQAQLSERAGISVEMVSRLERARCMPSVGTLVALSRALVTSPDHLLEFESAAGGDHHEVEQVVRIVRELPPARRKDVARIAEMFAGYGRGRS